MGTLYSSVIKDHYRNPRRRGRIPSPDAACEDVNPLCGDRVRIEVRVSDGIVTDARFTSDSCAICTASADLLVLMISGRSVANAGRITAGDLLSLLEADVRPSRMSCVTLSLDVLRGALAAAAVRS